MTRKEQSVLPAVRGRPRERRVDAAILDAALELFADGGLNAVTFEGVAARAGVSRSGVYRRWSTREDLVVAALAQRRADGEQGAEHWKSAGSVATVMTLFRDGAARALSRRQDSALLAQIAALDGQSPVKRAYWSTTVPRRQAFARMVEAARERGELPAGPEPGIVLDLLAGALFYRATMHPKPLTTRAARRYVDEVIAAVGLVRS